MDIKEKIMITAFINFAKKGYDGVSLNDILKEADVSKGGFYHHYPSKEELFRGMMDKIFFSFINNFCDILEDDNTTIAEKTKILKNMPLDITGFLPEKIKNNENFDGYYIYYSLLNEAIKKFNDIHERIADSYKRMRLSYEKMLNEGQKRGEIRKDIDCNAWAFIIISMIEGAFLMGAIDKNIDLKKIFPKITLNILKILSK